MKRIYPSGNPLAQERKQDFISRSCFLLIIFNLFLIINLSGCRLESRSFYSRRTGGAVPCIIRQMRDDTSRYLPGRIYKVRFLSTCFERLNKSGLPCKCRCNLNLIKIYNTILKILLKIFYEIRILWDIGLWPGEFFAKKCFRLAEQKLAANFT